MLDKPWIPGLTPQQQLHYQPVHDCTYWTVLSYFKNWNITIFSNKSTKSEAFDDNNKVVLDGIRDNTASLVQSGKYDAISTTYYTTMS